MFVYSVNSKQIKMAVLILVIALMAVALLFITKNSIEASENVSLNVSASNAEERIAYLSQFGWSVEEEPCVVKEIIIPAEFDDVYEQYNNIQKEQGFDLSQYCSKRVKKWTYIVTNYSGYEGKNCIRATILVLDGKVIGGDVCSVEIDGFMHGFVKPQ